MTDSATVGAEESVAVASPAHAGGSKRETGAASESALYRYVRSLDGLRGVAILWVLSLHLPGQMEPTGNPLARRGAIGVELFFAISGFLVTRSLDQCFAREARDGGRTTRVFRDFAARRVSRIWPPYFLALAAAFAGMLLDPTFREHSDRIRQVFWAYPAFLANYVIPSHEPSLSLTVMWSLCFEEQFYVILLLLGLFGRKRLPGMIAVAAVASLAGRLLAAAMFPEVFPKFVMQMETHWRFDALAWGCLVWIYHRPIAQFWEGFRHRRWLEAFILVAAVAVCVPVADGPFAQAVVYLVMAPVFAALVAALAFSPRFWLDRLLSWSPLALVGIVSYEIYLSHVVVFRVLDRLHLDRWLTLYYVICLTLSIAVGWLFHRLFGKPTQRVVRAWLSAGRAGGAG